MGKSILGVILGIVVGGIVIFGVESISHSLYGAVDVNTVNSREEFLAIISNMPTGAFVLVALAHFLGILLGGLTAFFVAGKKIEPLFFPVSLFLLGTILINVMITPPMWALLLDIGAALTGGVLAYILAKKWKN